MAAGVFAALCTATLIENNTAMAYVLLGSWLLAHTVETLAQIILQRRGF